MQVCSRFLMDTEWVNEWTNTPRFEEGECLPISIPGAEMKTTQNEGVPGSRLDSASNSFVPLSKSLLPSEPLVSSSVSHSFSKPQWFTSIVVWLRLYWSIDCVSCYICDKEDCRLVRRVSYYCLFSKSPCRAFVGSQNWRQSRVKWKAVYIRKRLLLKGMLIHSLSYYQGTWLMLWTFAVQIRDVLCLLLTKAASGAWFLFPHTAGSAALIPSALGTVGCVLWNAVGGKKTGSPLEEMWVTRIWGPPGSTGYPFRAPYVEEILGTWGDPLKWFEQLATLCRACSQTVSQEILPEDHTATLSV